MDAEGATVSWSHITLHCPEIHTYSHTQQFTRINCVNSHALLIVRDRGWLDSTPILPNVGVRYWMPNSTVAGTKNTHRVSRQYNCGMLRREHFVDLFRSRLYHLTLIVSHF
jgi:hypothetical protein